MFGTESNVAGSNIKGESVLPGLLITLMQKGMQYTDIEAHLTEVDEADCKVTDLSL